MAGDPTYILCIEIANSVTSVAISKDGRCLLVKETLEANKAADKMHLLIEELLADTGLSFSQLHAIALSSGPGSYTGLRIATAAAKGFCFSLNIPMIAVPTLQAMVSGIQKRYGFIDYDQYVPMIDARRMEVFTSFYSKNLELSRPFSSIILTERNNKLFDSDQKYILFGNGAIKAKDLVNEDTIMIFEGFIPSSEDLCLLAFKRFSENRLEDIVYFEPHYAKPFYSTQIK